MKIFYFVVALILTFLFKVQFDLARANDLVDEALDKDVTCKSSVPLKIGCTYDNCGKWVRWGIKKASRLLDYNVEFIELDKTQTDLATLDGILIPGGADIDPKYYTSKLPQSLKDHIASLDSLVGYSDEGKARDPFEYGLLEKYFSSADYQTLPVLGVCRGMQMLGVSQGIPLYVDIKSELGISNRRYKIDKVTVTEKNSTIASVMMQDWFLGVELHHQGLRIPYFNENRSQFSNINLTAVSNDSKIAEVIEFSNRPVMGVQFHPEFTFGKVRRRVFKWLLHKACMNQQSKASMREQK